jgi:LytS/YehU family sensor histidine kinase
MLKTPNILFYLTIPGIILCFFKHNFSQDFDDIWTKSSAVSGLNFTESTLWENPIFLGFVINASFVLIYTFYHFTAKQIRIEERLKAEFDKKLSNVEMTALRSQMNPHFIFNCLNSIDYYILKNETEKASDYLNRFSRLIRLILQNSRSNYVNLKDELEALRLYIEMESLRFHQKFDYRIEIDKQLNTTEFEIPPMLLQPYVENAIWHGLLHKKEQGMLHLRLGLEAQQLICSIKDNGVGRKAAGDFRSKSATKQKPMGMRITEDRISLINRLYDTKAAVEIIDLHDEKGSPCGTQVNLCIPI